MVVCGVIAKETCTLWTCALRGDLELEDHGLLFIGARQDERLLTVSALHTVLAPILVQLDLRFVGDDEATGVTAHSIVDVDREVSHLARQIKVLREGHVHSGRLRTDEAYLLLEGNDDIELRVVHDGAHRADMYSLTITQLALTVLIVEEICLHRHNLGLEEVAELDSELGPPLHEVERLG